MERYVWEITRELAALGHQVVVICERCHAEKPPGITVHELGEIAPSRAGCRCCVSASVSPTGWSFIRIPVFWCTATSG